MLLIAAIALTAATVVTGCEKDNEGSGDNGNTTEALTKKIKKVTHTATGGYTPLIVLEYVWEGDKLTEIRDVQDGKTYTWVSISYKDGKPLAVRVDNNGGGYFTDEFTYTWNGDKIEKEVYRDMDSESDDRYEYHYTYSNGKPSRIKTIYISDLDTGWTDYTDFKWDGDNMLSGSDEGELLYRMTYDNKKNPLYLPQVGIEGMEWLATLQPYLNWSKNNMTKFEDLEEDAFIEFKYKYTDDGFPQTMTYNIDGAELTFTYEYYE